MSSLVIGSNPLRRETDIKKKVFLYQGRQRFIFSGHVFFRLEGARVLHLWLNQI